MNRVGIAIMLIATIVVAVWAYNVNYDTKMALGRVDGLRTKIAAERERLQVLRVEWAYLNAAERLEPLVRSQNVHLGLVPMTAVALGTPATPPFPDGAPVEPGTDDPSSEIDALIAAVLGERGPRAASNEAPVPSASIETPAAQPAPAFPMPMPPVRPATWRGQ